HDDLIQVAIDRASYFFSRVNRKTTRKEFSKHVHQVTDSQLSVEQKIAILATSVRQYAELLTVGAARKYFEKVSKDTVLLKALYRRFQKLPTAVGPARYRALGPEELWAVEILLRAIKIVSPDD